jgi:hypothetical protein
LIKATASLWKWCLILFKNRKEERK